MQAMYSEIDARIHKTGKVTPPMLRPLRRFRWLLSLDQNNMVDKWFQEAIQQHVSGGVVMIEDGEAGDVDGPGGGKIVEASATASSSAKPMVSMLKPSSDKLVPSTPSKPPPIKATTGVDIDAFFAPKRRKIIAEKTG